MAFTGKPYNSTVAIKTKKDDDASSGYVYTTGKNSTSVDVSDVGSSYIPSSTRQNVSRNNYRGINICNQTRKNDTDKSTGTEICIGCLLKDDEKKQATHFCKTCDTHGRYICHTCMVDHNLWAGKNHDVVSLSVDKETDSVWQRKERQVQINPGKTDYHDIDSWFQQSLPDDDCEYGVLNERDMASVDATRNSNVSDYTWANSNSDAMVRSRSSIRDTFQEVYQHSDEGGYADYEAVEKEKWRKQPDDNFEVSEREYTWANSDLDVMRRPKMPLPNAYQKLEQNSDEELYERFTTVERETKNLRINEPNDNSRQASESTQPDDIQARRQGRLNGTRLRYSNEDQANNDSNRHALYRRSLVVDGYRQPFIAYANRELEYTLAEFYNETQNNVKHNPLIAKRTSCVIM